MVCVARELPCVACSPWTCAGNASGTCPPIQAGGWCGGASLKHGPSPLICAADVRCKVWASTGAGGLCGLRNTVCADWATCEATDGSICPSSACARGFTGTCQPLRVGDDCREDDKCWEGTSGLRCAPLFVAVGADESVRLRQECIVPKAEGADVLVDGDAGGQPRRGPRVKAGRRLGAAASAAAPPPRRPPSRAAHQRPVGVRCQRRRARQRALRPRGQCRRRSRVLVAAARRQQR